MPNHNPNQEMAAVPDVPKPPLPWQLPPGPKLRRQYLALRESGRVKANVLAASATRILNRSTRKAAVMAACMSLSVDAVTLAENAEAL